MSRPKSEITTLATPPRQTRPEMRVVHRARRTHCLGLQARNELLMQRLSNVRVRPANEHGELIKARSALLKSPSTPTRFCRLPRAGATLRRRQRAIAGEGALSCDPLNPTPAHELLA